jgi:hypothetical protein
MSKYSTHPYCDRNGDRIKEWGFYTGYNPGVYRVLLVGKTHSQVVKVVSGKGIPILKSYPLYLDNWWLRPSTKNLKGLVLCDWAYPFWFGKDRRVIE